MKQNNQDSFSNIILPQYEFNEGLKVYIEIDTPPKSIYKAIGYNDLAKIKEIKMGDDSEKRSSDYQKQLSMRASSLKRKQT